MHPPIVHLKRFMCTRCICDEGAGVGSGTHLDHSREGQGKLTAQRVSALTLKSDGMLGRSWSCCDRTVYALCACKLRISGLGQGQRRTACHTMALYFATLPRWLCFCKPAACLLMLCTCFTYTATHWHHAENTLSFFSHEINK